jgi:mRNA interferase RelE/StbE
MKKTYKVCLSKDSFKQLSRLDNQVKNRILKEIDVLAVNPLAGKQLTEPLNGVWSLRVGKYRVIYQQFLEEGLIVIQTVCHRKKVYDQ